MINTHSNLILMTRVININMCTHKVFAFYNVNVNINVYVNVNINVNVNGNLILIRSSLFTM